MFTISAEISIGPAASLDARFRELVGIDRSCAKMPERQNARETDIAFCVQVTYASLTAAVARKK